MRFKSVATMMAGCTLLLVNSFSLELARASAEPGAFVRLGPSMRPARESCSRARDRAAILRMTGTFDVSFSFEERRAFARDYLLAEPYAATAVEVVSVLEDAPERVSLQHVLIIETRPGSYMPLKHWRQDWTFEDTWLLQYNGDGTWTHRRLAPQQVRCTWSQAVWQVDDGPRYESFGRFSHRRRVSTWVSGPTLRPLPRREAARTDYDVLLATNTHNVWDEGWDHEESNFKWVLGTRSALVWEYGYNAYLRGEHPGAVVVEEYLTRTREVWADVRAEWEALLGTRGTVRVHATIDGVAPFDLLFSNADDLALRDRAERRALIHDMLAAYVEVVDR